MDPLIFKRIQEATPENILEVVTLLPSSARMINPEMWGDIALKVEIAWSTTSELLEDKKSELAKIELQNLQESKSVAEAKLKTAAREEYKEVKKLENKLTHLKELVRIAKQNQRTAQGI